MTEAVLMINTPKYEQMKNEKKKIESNANIYAIKNNRKLFKPQSHHVHHQPAVPHIFSLNHCEIQSWPRCLFTNPFSWRSDTKHPRTNLQQWRDSSILETRMIAWNSYAIIKNQARCETRKANFKLRKLLKMPKLPPKPSFFNYARSKVRREHRIPGPDRK